MSGIAAVTNKGHRRWRIFDGAFNKNILIDFLRRLIKGATKKQSLILGNLRVYHAKPEDYRSPLGQRTTSPPMI